MITFVRPGADDVLVLRQELVNAQTLMDKLTQEQEKEKAILEKEHQHLNEKYKMYVWLFQ